MRKPSHQPNGWHGKKCAEILLENTQPRLIDIGLALRLTRIYVRRNTWSARIKYKLLVTVDATRHACFSLEASFEALTWHWVEEGAKPLYRSGVGWGSHWLLMVKFRIGGWSSYLVYDYGVNDQDCCRNNNVKCHRLYMMEEPDVSRVHWDKGNDG